MHDPAASQDRSRSATDAPSPAPGASGELLSTRIAALARSLARSARRHYQMFEPLLPLQRRMILYLARAPQARVSELATVLGASAAQVSRAVKSLAGMGLVEREHRSQPLRLSAAGLEMSAAMEPISLQRERALTAGLSPGEMFELAALLANVLASATALVRESERALSARTLLTVAMPTRLVPAIARLAALLSRLEATSLPQSASLAQLDVRLLALVAAKPGITFMELVAASDRDKAHVSRALGELVRSGSMRRARVDGQASLHLTPGGEDLQRVYEREAIQRDNLLVSGSTERERAQLHGLVARLLENAAAMLAEAERG